MATSVPFSIEGVQQGWPDEPILYRIRVPARRIIKSESHLGEVIKYLIASRPPKGAGGIPDHRSELLAFNTVPVGDWNLGRLLIPHGSAEGGSILVWTESLRLDVVIGLLDAAPPWRDRKFDLVGLLDDLDAHRKSKQTDCNAPLSEIDVQCMNRVSAVVLPTPAHTGIAGLGPEAIGVWTWQPGHAHGIANEIRIHSIIQAHDPGLAPRFIGLITDNSTRVIGFLVERVPDAREAGPANLGKCRNALERLHNMGIAYSAPLERHSFLLCEGSASALLQGSAVRSRRLIWRSWSAKWRVLRIFWLSILRS